MQPWPIDEALMAPALALLLAIALPHLTARGLGLVLLRNLPERGEARARRLVAFRLAALLTGVAQLQLVWMLSTRSIGPTLLDRPGDWPALLFGAAATAVAFVSGGIARRIEEPEERRASAVGAAILRLRLVPLVAGPALVAVAASRLPMIEEAGSAPHVVWPWALVALALTILGVAFGGLALALGTGALVSATPSVRELARDVARREGAALALVLRLPTTGTRFANAAAIPWARTMVVTDRIVELLSPLELRAVLAHEAGHLTEGPRVALARLGSATMLLFTLTSGVRIATASAGPWTSAGLFAAIAVSVLLLIRVRRLARRMEERADVRAKETVGAIPLAGALTRLHDEGQMPRVTGARRVHPDLYDRLAVLGVDQGPRPPPPRRKRGLLVGVVGIVVIAGLGSAIEVASDVAPAAAASAPANTATWRMRVDPWDPDAMLALAWRARDAEMLDLAEARARLVARMGPDAAQYYELWAELHAARGHCDAARDAFQRSLEERAGTALGDVLSRPMSLGGFRLPPTLISRCGIRTP